MRQQFPGHLLWVSAGLFLMVSPALAQPPTCRAISADVVALDQAFYTNRMGALQAGGMIFALKRDVVPISGPGPLKAGQVMLRPGKRPRPIVLRMNVGDCLTVRFTNLLKPTPTTNLAGLPSTPVPPVVLPNSLGVQPSTRYAGVHVMGMQPRTVASDGSWVGANASSLVAPDGTATYEFYAEAEGAYLLYSTTADTGNAWAYGGQLSQGLFGSVAVQPEGAEWYRSQVTRADMALATTGVTADGHPIFNYAATGSDGTPVLKMLNAKNEIVYTDLTAVITGPNAGPFTGSGPSFDPNPTYPNRRQPYREFAIHYHDDFVITQAFASFMPDAGMFPTLASGRDMFAINYGTGGIGAEVWANRLGRGPSATCDTCKFEEFFLSSWATGDPAMVVDVPANAANPATNKIATKALFPDDPSNVYHSYIGDHVKFRILHAGTNITHVHHQHAHQWLHSPNSDTSDYRDSQMISPGAGYTLDQTYHGSGNKNQTVGDSIFHCHFYPHFAQGMWSLWRTHDVFEAGTAMMPNGRVVANDWNRALPDGEIGGGSPTPAIVPLPTLPMAPIPARTRMCPVFGPADYVQFSGASCPAGPSGATPTGFKALVNQADLAAGKNPGFPFFVPGVGGKRAPHPPLDYAWEEVGDEDGGSSGIPKLDPNGKKIYLDGGLPRNLTLKDTGTIYEKHNKWDFSKDNDRLVAVELDQEGTSVEKAAMALHAIRCHPSFLPNGTAAHCAGSPATGGYILNGQPAVPGAPFANPAIDIDGNPVPSMRRYKAAAVEMDVVQNKKGWHYPQQRILALWGDVEKLFNGTARPEPLFFRANSTEVIEFWHTNLVPNYYELDDFQVRTPTDILGQHIHLVKFDVTSSDGAGNGFNYEDGTLAPPEVVEQIHAINRSCSGAGGTAPCGIWSIDATSQRLLAEKEIPFFKVKFPGRFPGAQTTIQKWYADPLLDNFGKDRTMRTVFTHDHFGPSTHQQAGLYAGLVLEPQCSDWRDPIQNTLFGGRFDGGPTSWQAVIVPKADPGCPTPAPPAYREFLLEFQDRTLAYQATSRTTPIPYTKYASPVITAGMTPWGWADFDNAVSPPKNLNATPPFLPKLVTQTFGEGTFSVNYANEPVGFRIKPPAGTPAVCPPDPFNANVDLGHVFRSICRTDPAMNVQPAAGTPINSAQAGGFKFAPPFLGATGTDPYTPLLRAYEGDLVQIRTLVGAHMEPHSFHVQGLKWQFEPSFTNSGFRATQGMGISEHYEMIFRVPATRATDSSGTAINQADYLYEVSSAVDGIENGNWGLLRAYKSPQPDLQAVPGPDAKASPACPAAAPKRPYAVSAVFARDVLDGPLVYNARGAAKTPGQFQIVDWNAMMYVRTGDLDANGKLKANVPREPLILRAAAGDCIEITLENRMPDAPVQLNIGRQSTVLPNAGLRTSRDAGLRPQLVSYDVTQNDGVNAGLNPVQTIPPVRAGVVSSKVVQWYAGNVTGNAGVLQHTPIEFGAISLAPADPLMQHPYGLLGALVIEPSGSTWVEDSNSRASATVTPASGPKFREFVEIVHDDLAALRFTSPKAIDAVVGAGGPQWMLNGQPLANKGSVSVVAGDSVVFSVKSGFHGITFMDKDQALASLDFGSFAQFFKAQPSVGPTAWGTDGMTANPNLATLLAALQVKPTTAANQSITSLAFECTIHTTKMSGVLTIQRGTGPATMKIDGVVSGGPKWAVNGAPQNNNSTVAVAVGQTLVFGVQSGTHGITFMDKAAAQAAFDFGASAAAFKDQPSVGPTAWGTDATSTAGVLATITVKNSVPSTIKSVAYQCTLHKAAMAGTFQIGGGPPPPPPPPAKLAIDGVVSGGPKWALNGTPQNNNSTINIAPSQTIAFGVQTGTHGITFMDKATAQAVFDFGASAAAFKDQPSVGPTAWGTDATSAAGVLATITVKATVPSTIKSVAYQCTFHKAAMAGTLQIQAGGGATPQPSAGVEPLFPPSTLPTFPNWTKGINYRTEPLSYRYQDPNWLGGNAPIGISRALSNTLVSADPETPVFSAPAGMPVRIRVAHPGGNLEQVITLHGHKWQEVPYTNDSAVMGVNPTSQSTGSRDTFGPNASFDILLPSAGGAMAAPGDYLLRTFIGTDFQFGMWNMLRVGEAANAQGSGKDTLVVTRYEPVDNSRVMVTGVNTVNPVNGQMATTVSVFSGNTSSGAKLGDAAVDPMRGTWVLQVALAKPPDTITVVSNQNGTVTSGIVAAVAATGVGAVGGVPTNVRTGSPSDSDTSVNQFRDKPARQPDSIKPSIDKPSPSGDALPRALAPPATAKPAAKPPAKPPAAAKPPAKPPAEPQAPPHPEAEKQPEAKRPEARR
jgi:manganese oxidase